MAFTFEQLKRIKNVAAQREPADLLVKNVRIINTITQEMHMVDMAIAEGMVVGYCGKEGKEVIDAKGMYASPLLVDSHMHIESTLLTPGILNDLLLPRGIGTIVADPHEIANVSGKEGIDFILKAVEPLDLDFKIALPSCVPSTQFEHAGAILKADDLKGYYTHPHVIGLAEVMDYFSVLDDDDMLHKIHDAQSVGKTIDGHGAILDGMGLDLYSALHISDDHECIDREGMRERLRRGIYTFIREGTVCKNLKGMIDTVNYRNYRYVCLCTDDKHPDDLASEGGIDGVVRMAIDLGMDPIMALTLVTLNPSTCFKIENAGALAPGFKADFFLFEDLHNIQPKEVYKNGLLVAKNGKVVSSKKELKIEVSDKIIHSINYKPFKISDIQIDLKEANGMRMIEIVPGNVLTKLVVEEVRKNMFNHFTPSVKRDHAKLVVIERHNATGNIGVCGVKGFGLSRGAIATTVAHDSHNIIAIGMNDFDIVMAVEQLKKNGGGYVIAVDGKIWASVTLEVSGLMTNSSLEEVLESLHHLHTNVGYVLQHKEFNPFLMLSFISLPVIPEVKLTDIGLIDVCSGTVLDLPVVIEEVIETQEAHTWIQ